MRASCVTRARVKKWREKSSNQKRSANRLESRIDYYLQETQIQYRSCHVLAKCLCMRPCSIKYGKIHWRCQFE